MTDGSWFGSIRSGARLREIYTVQYIIKYFWEVVFVNILFFEDESGGGFGIV